MCGDGNKLMNLEHKTGILRMILYGFALHVRKNDIPDNKLLDLVIAQIIAVEQGTLGNNNKKKGNSHK